MSRKEVKGSEQSSNAQEKEDRGEKERYKYLNAEFQIIARRDKKTSRLNKINLKIQQKSKQIRLQHFFH